MKNAKEKPSTWLSKNTKTVAFDVYSLHSNESNTKVGSDIIEDLVLQENNGKMTTFHTGTIPLIKMKCFQNLHKELQNIELEETYDGDRAKRFQVLKMIFSEDTLVKRLMTCSMQIACQPGKAWNIHPIWENYNFDVLSYKTSIVDFIRFFRNHDAHFYQAEPDFQVDLLRCRRIDDSRFCKFIDQNFPSILNFIFTLYLAACDNQDEVRRLFPSYGENADLLLLEDLESFLCDTITKNFPKFQGKFLMQMDQFLHRNIIYDREGNFISLRNANKN